MTSLSAVVGRLKKSGWWVARLQQFESIGSATLGSMLAWLWQLLCRARAKNLGRRASALSHASSIIGRLIDVPLFCSSDRQGMIFNHQAMFSPRHVAI